MAVLKILQFNEDLIWLYYWKKVGVTHELLILANIFNSAISPNKSCQ